MSSTHDSRMSEEHYIIAKRVLRILGKKTRPATNAVIFNNMPEVSGDDQKRVMKFLRRRGLVEMTGRSRWARYVLSKAFRRGEVALPSRLPVRSSVFPALPPGGLVFLA